jgi:hypothetical protein
MAKGIHPSCDPMGIIADVINKGLKITMATRILSNKDKYPLVMFMLTFEHGEVIKNIFEIETIQEASQNRKCEIYAHPSMQTLSGLWAYSEIL